MLGRITDTARVRAPFHALLQQVIHATCERFPPPAAGPLVELGAGDGQLLPLLPGTWAPRLIHTEPLPRCAEAFAQRHPTAQLRRAASDALPFDAGSVAGVVALCVLDLVADLQPTVQELQRVLARGARVWHFLDQTPFPSPLLESLAPIHQVPLPNVFGGPTDDAWPDDIFVAPEQDLVRVLTILQRHAHPLSHPLQRYLSVFRARPFAAERAREELETLASSVPQRQALRQLFQITFQLASAAERVELAAFRGQTLSSSKQLALRMERAFLDGGFEVEQSEILLVSRTSPLPSPASPTYQSLIVGQMRNVQPPRPDGPQASRTFQASRTLHSENPSQDADAGTLTQVLGVLVFVAKKL